MTYQSGKVHSKFYIKYYSIFFWFVNSFLEMLSLMKMQKENINITPYLHQAETQALQILPRSVPSTFPLCAWQAPVFRKSFTGNIELNIE